MNTTVRLALVGPMGIGKTTAIRTLCGDTAIDCDVPNLDTQSHAKATTTVGADFGEVDMGDGDMLQIYGCPGQERFSFVRQWVLSSSVGVFVMIDPNEPGSAAEAAHLLSEIGNTEQSPLPAVLVSRPASLQLLNDFSVSLGQLGHGLVPVLQADVRDQGQMRDTLQVLVSMLSLKGASA